MTKCKVCGKEHDGSECPLCHYVAPEFIVGNYDPEAEISAKREELLKSLELGVELYSHHDEDGYVVPDKDLNRRMFGSCSALAGYRDTVWLNEKLCSARDVTTIPVRIAVCKDGALLRSAEVPVESFPQQEFLYVGIEMVPDSLQFRVHVKNASGEHVSKPVHLLG